jgi:hypothetical protein
MSSEPWTTIPSKPCSTSPDVDDNASDCLSSYSDLYDDFDFWAYSGHYNYDSQMECCICNPKLFDSSYAEDEVAWMFEPYRDFRSAGRAKQRERTCRENKSDRHGFRSRMQWQSDCRRDNKHRKKALIKIAKWESQKEGYGGCRVVEWDIRLPEELDQLFKEIDHLKHRENLDQYASTFESAAPCTKVGKPLVAWARRRIAEMQSVKESRMQRNPARTFKPMVLQGKLDYKHERGDKIYIGNAVTTNLSKNSYDALGYELLRCVLDTGKWEVDIGDALVLEAIRRCSLYEWLGEHGKEVVEREKVLADEWRNLSDADSDVSGYESDCGWSIVSCASSEAWSVVDAP